jgi:hypothetical protein
MPEREPYDEEQMAFSRRLVQEGRRGRVVQDADIANDTESRAEIPHVSEGRDTKGPRQPAPPPDWGAGARPGSQPIEPDMNALLRGARSQF